MAGSFATTPFGMILHGTRSTQPYSVDREYMATLNYIAVGAGGLGWNATVGNGVVCLHMALDQWGHNAREHSSHWVAVEIAQALLGWEVTDSQIEGVAWLWVQCREKFGERFPLRFVNHSDLPAGVRDGKTDIEPRGYHSVIDRVTERLRKAGYR